MPVELAEHTATFVGATTADDLEDLVGWLRTTASARVDLSRCTNLHAGAVQALVAFRPQLAAAPTDEFLAKHLLPLLQLHCPLAAPITPVPRTRQRAPRAATAVATPAPPEPAAPPVTAKSAEPAVYPAARQRKPRSQKATATGR